MKVHPYLAKAKIVFNFQGKEIEITRYGWSDLSQEDALCCANNRCQIAKEKILMEGKFATGDVHYYSTGQVYEEPIEHFPELNLINTRNNYGAICLNVDNVMFLDIDDNDLFNALPKKKRTIMETNPATGFFARLFGETIREEKVIEEPLIEPLHFLTQKILAFIQQNPKAAFNLYRTAAGYRIIVLHSLFDIENTYVSDYFQHFLVDELYTKLCFSQQCYRARLTPKPWRMGLSDRWDKNYEDKQKSEWLNAYEIKAQNYATCHFIQTFGHTIMPPKVATIVKLHDERTKAYSLLPLA